MGPIGNTDSKSFMSFEGKEWRREGRGGEGGWGIGEGGLGTEEAGAEVIAGSCGELDLYVIVTSNPPLQQRLFCHFST